MWCLLNTFFACVLRTFSKKTFLSLPCKDFKSDDGMKSGIVRFFVHNFEAWFWLTSLILLAFMPPESTQTTFCVWHLLGFESCLGCGLGHSISNAFHGHWITSFKFHPLGLVAIAILTIRIVSVFNQNYTFERLNKKFTHDKNL